MEHIVRQILRTLRTSLQDACMSVVATAQALERRERARAPTLKLARQRLASRLRIGVGTFENLVRGRVKKIDHEIKRRLDDLLVRELEAEIMRLQHELEMARQGGDHPGSEHVLQVERLLSQARALLDGKA
jgi:hypothetical protein